MGKSNSAIQPWNMETVSCTQPRSGGVIPLRARRFLIELENINQHPWWGRRRCGKILGKLEMEVFTDVADDKPCRNI